MKGKKMKRLFITTAIVLGMFIPTVASACQKLNVTAGAGLANVRATPGYSGEILWKLSNGSPVYLCTGNFKPSDGNTWVWIEFISREEPWTHKGWIAISVLSLPTELQNPPES